MPLDGVDAMMVALVLEGDSHAWPTEVRCGDETPVAVVHGRVDVGCRQTRGVDGDAEFGFGSRVRAVAQQRKSGRDQSRPSPSGGAMDDVPEFIDSTERVVTPEDPVAGGYEGGDGERSVGGEVAPGPLRGGHPQSGKKRDVSIVDQEMVRHDRARVDAACAGRNTDMERSRRTAPRRQGYAVQRCRRASDEERTGREPRSEGIGEIVHSLWGRWGPDAPEWPRERRPLESAASDPRVDPISHSEGVHARESTQNAGFRSRPGCDARAFAVWRGRGRNG